MGAASSRHAKPVVGPPGGARQELLPPTPERVYDELTAIEVLFLASPNALGFDSAVLKLNRHLREEGLALTDSVSAAYSRLDERFRCEEEKRLTAAALLAFATQLHMAPAVQLRGSIYDAVRAGNEYLYASNMQRMAPRLMAVLSDWQPIGIGNPSVEATPRDEGRVAAAPDSV